MTALEKRLKRRYTARDRHHWVMLRVGNQTFRVTAVCCESRQNAEWFRDQLARALADIVVREA